ncbi:hypothetical protein EV361DRAFT_390295 [Lentinula raphanica]|nr:hypothetical protein EV361DRAFT_390295 [Lentinula raphanica]
MSDTISPSSSSTTDDSASSLSLRLSFQLLGDIWIPASCNGCTDEHTQGGEEPKPDWRQRRLGITDSSVSSNFKSSSTPPSSKRYVDEAGKKRRFHDTEYIDHSRAFVDVKSATPAGNSFRSTINRVVYHWCIGLLKNKQNEKIQDQALIRPC